MNELTLTVLRFGLLALLWFFIFAVVGVMRKDLYGAKAGSRGAGSRSRGSTKPSRAMRKGPTHINIIEGAQRGITLPLSESGVLLGRNAECGLVLSDDFASGRHAKIYPEDDGWYIDDLGSTNGTFIDNHRVGEHEHVDTGTQIKIGQTILELRK